MDVRELRIGNYVKHFENGIVLTVGRTVAFKTPTNTIRVDVDDLEPIPLTEEWLLKFGFEKESNKSYSTGEEIVYSVYRLDELTYNSIQKNWWFNGVLSNQPIYVHQLQNLYHALTNEELTLIK